MGHETASRSLASFYLHVCYVWELRPLPSLSTASHILRCRGMHGMDFGFFASHPPASVMHPFLYCILRWFSVVLLSSMCVLSCVSSEAYVPCEYGANMRIWCTCSMFFIDIHGSCVTHYCCSPRSDNDCTTNSEYCREHSYYNIHSANLSKTDHVVWITSYMMEPFHWNVDWASS